MNEVMADEGEDGVVMKEVRKYMGVIKGVMGVRSVDDGWGYEEVMRK